MSNFTNWLSENDSLSRLLLPPNNLRRSLASLFSVQGKRSRQVLSVAFTVLMAVFFSQSSSAQELIVNPGFESKFTGWQSNKNPIKTVIATNPIHSGVYAAHINNSTVGDEYFYQNVNATASAKYSFSVWAMVHDATKYGSVGVNVFDANWVKIPTACIEMEVNTTSFKQYTKSFTVPDNAKYLQVFGYTHSAILKVDDYSLTQTCNNVTSGGTIAAHQTGCSGFDPVAFTSVTNPSGGSSNPLEIVWLKSTTSSDLTTATQSQWTTIQGATGSTYDSGPLTQTTYFIRCSRRAGCTDYVGESNVIKVTITGNCCNNVTSGGTIAAHQTGCSGFDPVAFTSVTDPSGGSSNPLEFVWLKSTTSSVLTTATASQWTTISGATGLTYDSGPLTQTTYFIRCSRRAGCTDYDGESNVIKVTITGSCGGKDPVCLSRKTQVLSNLLCGGGTTNYGLFFEDLKGNVASPSQYYTVKSGELTEFCDGTAVLNYTACVNGGGANDCINVAVNFSGRTGTPPTGSPVANTHCTTYSPNVSDWYYYPISSGTFSGTGIYAGLAGGYTQDMAAFQIGTGGGLNEISKFGASSWFKINITNGGTNKWSTVSTKGDINVNLGTSTTIASVTASANPTAICKGESVKLTATLDANSKSANCSPTYAWVGSNGFTSTQATVTNTNVQSATTYTVTVTFTAANGSKCSVTATTGVALNAVCCDNVTNGGQIAASQSGCAPFDPAPFTEVAAPSGGSGAVEYLWLKSTTTTVFTSSNMNTEWFQVIGGTGAGLDVGPLTKTTAYIRCSRRAGCSDYVGESNIIIITVNTTPAAPTVTGAAFCGTNTATLNATCEAGATPNWYASATGGSTIATGTSYITPSISTTTSYFVSCKSTAGCESVTRVEVKLTVNPNAPVPTVTPANSCGPGSITLGAVCGTGSTANWYAAATGGSSIATGANYTTVSLSASTTYYVSCKTDLGCESPRVAVKATVIAKITDGGKIQSNEDICPGKTPALITSVTPASGGDASLAIEYIWLQTTSLTNGVCPQNIVGQNLYTAIPNTNTENYQPGAITQTTCYIRCSRRAGCTDYIGGESNAVKKTLLTNCQGKDPICLSRKTPVLNTLECSSAINYGLFFADLKGNVSTPSSFYSVKSGEFTEFCDGTAVLSYVACVNGGGANDCITTTVNFSGRTGTPPAGSPVSNTHCNNYLPNVSDWYYYPTSNGTFSGTGIYAGLTGTYTQNMGAFQVGTGGSLNEITKFGASSWFKINITNIGTNHWTTASKDGDININLGSSTTIASITATANPKAICSGEKVDLTATLDVNSKSANCSPSYSWVGSNGFTSTQATVTNTNVTASTTYTVTVTFTAVNGSKCSVTATTGVTVNPTPATPTVTPATICGTGTVTLGATCATGATAQWYTTPTGGTAIATGPSYTTPSISATTPYYVSCKSTEGCLSARVEVKATINTNGVTPAVKPAAICGTGTLTLGATCSTGSTAMWYSSATGGTVIATGSSYTTPSISSTTTYYVSCKTTEGCESNRTEVKATINPIPNAPTVTPAAICGTGTVTLGATCSTGTPQWYAVATGGTVIATGGSYTTPSISSTTTYYVSCKTTEGCESNRTEVKATINPIPNAPTVTPAAICGTGTVTLGATCSTGTPQWYAVATGGSSIATGASYTTPSISSTTTYYVSCKTTEGCESNRTEVKATINPIPNAPTVTPAAICGTGTVTLGATCSTGSTAMWYSSATGGTVIATGSSYTTPSISTTTSYYVSCKTTEGCESNRTEVKATINPIPNAPTVTPAAICGTGTVTLGATCTTGTPQWYAVATGGNSIATGGSYTTPSISSTTTYYVSCKTTEGCESNRTEVKATINPIPNAPTVTPAAICGTGTVTLGATCTTGTPQWYAVATGGNSIATGASYTTPSISSTTTYYVSCKTTEGCESNRTEVKATINPIPNAPTVTPAAICGTGTVTLGATCSTGSTAMWYSSATGGTVIATGSSYTTPSISATTTYYVSCKTTEGCESNRTEVKATINPIPNAPTVTPAAICGTGTVTLGATCTTGTPQWYAVATGGTVIATGGSYTTPSISSTTTYYVSCKTTEGCESNRTEVKATINPIPNAPTVTPAAICGTGTVTLGATCSTGTPQWYAVATGGNSIATGASYTTPSISSTTTYYVSCKTTEGCESNRTEVKATINPIPNAPTVTPAAICGTGTVTLGATCSTGTPQWYAVATGGNSIATGASYTTPSISSTTTYYVSCKTTEGCESNRTEVKATINPIPNAPTVTPAAICGTGTVTLGATCSTGSTAMWYSSATGGTVIATGSSYTTPSISTTTSYYVSCKTTEGCESNRTEVKATINPIPNAPTVTPAAICGTGTVTLGATCTTGTPQWYAVATGGNSIATGGSYTTPSISSTTTYYVSCKTTEGCESNRTEVKATINPIPNAPTVTPAAICGTGTVTLGATCTTGTPQWYAVATGGNSIATGASYTTPSISSTTTYYVSCKTTEGCESNRTEVKATINPIPNAPTVTPAAICGTGTVTLGATCSTGSTAMWYSSATGGTVIATGSSYTTPSISATTTYYVSCKTTEGCESNRTEVKATINPIPNAPTVTPAAICGTGTVTLGATCTTGIANWYSVATGGTVIATGASYTTPSISATTTYYVSCKTTEGCESNRTEVKATINPIPNAPSVTPAAICGTGTVTLGATCSTGTPQWYAVATGGSSIATGASYTTPSISSTTTYYVSCKTTEGCESNRTEVKATINPIPNAPTVTPAAICGTGTVTLGATCSTGTPQWYAVATGGNSIATGASYTTPSISSTTTYYVSCKTTEGCESNRTEVKATINPIPNAPSVTPAAICGTGTVTLGATCTTGTPQWYAVATGGNSIATGASYTTPSISSTTTYYVSCKTTEGCESNRTEVKATINPIPNAPSVTPAAICGTGTVTLGATCSTGTPQWYAVATGGNSIATGASYTTPSISSTTTYYVSCKTTEGCESTRAEVKATINPIPNAPTVTPAAICGTGTVTLGATCTTGIANWYSVATGGTVIATGASYTTPSISSTTTYYVSCKTTEGCESNRTEVKATINPIPNAPTVTPAAICGTGTVTLGATCSTGTPQWYAVATGGNSIATGASYTTPSISLTTTYYVSCKTTEGCESNRTEVKATVNSNPVAPTVTPAKNCGNGSVTLGATCSAGIPTWYAVATGGSSIATGTSYTTPTLSTTTSYYVSCKSSTGCESARTEVKATIIGKITDGGTIKADEIICVGATPSKITSVTPASGGDASLAIEYLWLKTTSLTSTGTCPSNIGGQNLYTPIPGATLAEYQPGAITQTTCYIRCSRRAGCTDYEGESNTVKKSTEATSAIPTVKPAAICGTGTVTLGATCISGIANWYVAATGGSAITTGASYTTSSISATTSYYVSCKSANAGCESARVEVKATINPIPASPSAIKNGAICGTGTVELGAICTVGTAQWYAVATGGSVITTGPVYTTPSISTTTSYYVSCKSSAGCESGRTEVKATVNANASAPTVTPAAICGTGTVTLGANCTTGTATWYAAATGGNSIATGASYTTPSISSTTSYFVSCKSNADCESARIEVKATINAIPTVPSVTPAAICGTGTVTLGATCTTGTAQWYAAATGGSVITTGASFVTPSISATTSYYVSCKSTAGCESGRTEVKASINAGGTAPTVTPATSCGNGSVTLGATCSSGVAQWYAAATGGTAIVTGASYTTPTLSATTSYYVSCKSSAGCESARTEVKATIIGKITDGGTIKADETICGSGTPAKITSVTLPSGGSANVAIEYIWLKTTSLTSSGACPANVAGQTLYTPIPGSTLAEYQPSAITQTTCYIRCSRRAGCTDYDGESNTVKKTITNPFTVTATANPASTCAGGTVNITTTTTATGTVTYTWKGPDGFTASTKDVTLANVTLAKGGVYTVTVLNGTCSATATAHVKVTNCLKLGDTVFNDKNNNGKQDAGEPNIPGVTVKLYNSANVLVTTTTTDPITGKYLFTNLAPGDYTVEIIAPAGYKSSTGTNGSATGTYEPAPSPNNNVDGDDNGTKVSGQTIRSLPVTLTIAGSDNLTVDFGLFKPASIGDYVFRDLNGDGKQDAGEGGVNGVTVKLFDNANNLVATLTTGPDGKYLFDNLIAGNYTVEFVKSTLASGFNFSPAGTTTPDKDSDANVTTGKTGTITLTEGQVRTDVDAGITTPCDTDKTPPVLTACPSDVLIKTRGTYAYVSWTEPTATDNCGTPIVTTTNASGSAFPVGSTTVTYTATDAKGNKVTCSFVVNVVKIITCDVDTQAPVFYDCPTDITVTTSGSSSVVYWDHPAVGDNCGIPSIVYNYEPGSSFPVGVTIVKYTAKDAKGNTSYCTFKITVTNRNARTSAIAAASPEKVASEADVNVENQVNIYPNPSNTDFAIELSADLMRANSAVEVNIIGMTGNSHFSQTAVGKEAVSVKVPVETMPSGTYFVNVGLDNGRMIIKKLQIIK